MALRIKRYEEPASELDDILQEIKEELGPDVKIQTRKFRKGGFLNLFGGKQMVEVVALVETDAVRSSSEQEAKEEVEDLVAERGDESDTSNGGDSTNTYDTPASGDDSGQADRSETQDRPAPGPVEASELTGTTSTEPGDSDNAVEEMRRELNQIRRQLAQLQEMQEQEMRQKDVPSSASLLQVVQGDTQALENPEQQAAFEDLLEWDIPPVDALELLNKAVRMNEESDESADREKLISRVKRIICGDILLNEGIHLPEEVDSGKVVALIGPTGVGKTTSIAKLAAEFLFSKEREVSMVSLDTYRIAAPEQLRTYAEIMGIPLDVVFSRQEFDEVLTRHREEYEITFVDTAGRSTFNEEQINELADYFDRHPPDQVHLVVDTTTKRDDIKTTLENFGAIGYDCLVLSKLDETNSLGTIYNINKLTRKPISYFTVGQDVPEDLRVADLEFVSKWMETGQY